MKKTSHQDAMNWFPTVSLVLVLLLALCRPGMAPWGAYALIVAVLACLQGASLALLGAERGDVMWGALFKQLLGPLILPVYGLAAGGLLYLGLTSSAGCGQGCGRAEGVCEMCAAHSSGSATAAKLASPSMCGGSCGSGSGGCGSGGCGKSGGGCGSGCGGGSKKATANAKGVANVNIPPPRTKMNAVPPAAANLPGLNGPNARPLPAGVVPNAAAPMPAGVAPAASPGVEPSAKGVESVAQPPSVAVSSGQSPVDGPQKAEVSVQSPSPAPIPAAKGEVIKIPLPAPAAPPSPVAAPAVTEPSK